MNVDCVIVGGGISGPVAAQEPNSRGIPFVPVEKAARYGGVIRTEHVDGSVVDAGPDALVTQKPAGIALCRELAVDRAPARSTRAVVANHGRLVIFRGVARVFCKGKTPHDCGKFSSAGRCGSQTPASGAARRWLDEVHRLFVSGAGIRGVGIADCAGDARTQAAAAAEYIRCEERQHACAAGG